jgi:adenine deaminase
MFDQNIIKVAKGEKKADIVLKNVNIINVFSGEIETGDVALYKQFIAGVGEYKGEIEYDLKGLYLSPGLIDSHIHIESTLLTIPAFAEAVVPLGTTSVFIDPHEIANVLGLDGIRYMLKSSKYNPLNVFIMLPSCVPATNMETAGAELRAFDLLPFIDDEWVKGLAEMMNFPGVINLDQEVIDKLKLMQDKIIDGHSPSLSGKELNAYISAGISSDHECITAEEAMEKLRKGMYIMIREGTIAKNLKDLISIVNEKTVRRCLWATDDKHPSELLSEGHINYLIKKAVKLGLNPIYAIQMATINAAEHFRIPKLGAIAPGYYADLVIFDNLENFKPLKVFKNGELVAEDGKYLYKREIEYHSRLKIRSSINIKWLTPEDFQIKATKKRINVIEIVNNQLITKKIIMDAKIENGFAVSDIENDIIKCLVIERHYASDNIGKGFVKGFGLKKGALASTVAHDSHNIIVIGVNDFDMEKAVIHLRKINGGFVVVENGKVLAELSLPIAGLMTTEPIQNVIEKLKNLNEKAKSLGVKIEQPFLMLSFLSLPVIPELKLTDKGLVDVLQFKFIDLFVD